MGLVLKLPPKGRVIINGCVLRNADRVQSFHIENRADVILEKNLVTPGDTRGTVAGELYRMLQTALLAPSSRETLMPEIHDLMARLLPVIGGDLQTAMMEAATCVSAGDWYGAMRRVRPVWDRETELTEGVRP